MKKYIFKTLGIFLIAFIPLFVSCTKDDESSLNSKVIANTTSGAILRTVKVNSATFNFTNLESKWSITSEVQDDNNGNNVSEIKLFSKLNNGTESFIKSFGPSNYVAGPNGYPRLEISATLAETLSKLGLVSGQYTPADKLNMRLVAIMNDGRQFTSTNATATILQSYFNSPFAYSAQFSCPLTDASIFNGDYKVVVDAWQDYAVNDVVPVSYVAADGAFKFRINNTNNPYLVNTSSYYIVTVNPVDNTVTVTSNEPLNYGVPPTNVIGTGTVGSCTGDINLKLTFSGGFSGTNQTFNLVKV